jgi:plasmid maintenance system antidote protein VapI
MGAWAPLAKVLRLDPDRLEKIVNGRRNVHAGLALRVARVVDVPIDDLLAGATYRHECALIAGHPPNG